MSKTDTLSQKQKEKLLAEKKRAVWSDVLANPDQKYSEAVMESCGGSPNALFAEAARLFVERAKELGWWDHEKRYEFQEAIF